MKKSISQTLNKEKAHEKYWYTFICDEWWEGWIPVPIDINKEGEKTK